MIFVVKKPKVAFVNNLMGALVVKRILMRAIYVINSLTIN